MLEVYDAGKEKEVDDNEEEGDGEDDGLEEEAVCVDGHTGWTDNNRSVHLLCSYLFEYQDAFQMNTNI